MKKSKFITVLTLSMLALFTACTNPASQPSTQDSNQNSGQQNNSSSGSGAKLDIANARYVDIKKIYQDYLNGQRNSEYANLECLVGETLKIDSDYVHYSIDRLFTTYWDIDDNYSYLVINADGTFTYSQWNNELSDDKKIGTEKQVWFAMNMRSPENIVKNTQIISNIRKYDPTAQILDVYTLRNAKINISLEEDKILYIPYTVDYYDIKFTGQYSTDVNNILRRSSLEYNSTLQCYEFVCRHDKNNDYPEGRVTLHFRQGKESGNSYSYLVQIKPKRTY